MKLDKFSMRFFLISLVFLSVALGQNVYAAASVLPRDNKGVKEAVETMFADSDQMIAIAKCESGFQQYTSKGTTFTGAGGRYVGVFQISTGHISAAKKLGFDIYTLEGNLGYANHLYKKQGVGPWKGCVKNSPTEKNTSAAAKKTTPLLTKNMSMGVKDSQVKTLQKILNNSSYLVSRSGPGSLGKESDVFGSKTRDAIKRFQCAKKIVCSGTEKSTGYGYVGPATRAALLKEASKLKL